MFTRDDINILKERDLSKKVILEQLERFAIGFDAIDLNRAPKIGDGIRQLSSREQAEMIQLFEHYGGTVSKFVPASGAATRMFKELLEFRRNYSRSPSEHEGLFTKTNHPVSIFFKNLQSFAFYGELRKRFEEKHNSSLEEAQLRRDYIKILNTLLDESGLNYGNLPKGLLRFHSYGEEARTPATEHLIEGWGHSVGDKLNIHFTVSPEHIKGFSGELKEAKKKLDFGEYINASFSIQKRSTDTIAANVSNEPFRDSDGNLLFRPAGHGALLENLNELNSDLIFIKNIDNVLPDRLKDTTIKWKKILGGVLLYYQAQVFDLLRRRDDGIDISKEGLQLLSEVGVSGLDSERRIEEYLNRPMRVCGMVKNEGEPGGGPFWVNGRDMQTLQIVESAQIDLKNDTQASIANSATHFNPVDLVCGIRDYKGEKFDLVQYRDNEQGFISFKSFGGKDLKAMELPGLWNGGMANWNTIFVEVPIETFNPVKSVNDLLKKEHQPASLSTS